MASSWLFNIFSIILSENLYQSDQITQFWFTDHTGDGSLSTGVPYIVGTRFMHTRGNFLKNHHSVIIYSPSRHSNLYDLFQSNTKGFWSTWWKFFPSNIFFWAPERKSVTQVCRTRVRVNDADFRVNCGFNEQKRAALPSDWLQILTEDRHADKAHNTLMPHVWWPDAAHYHLV